MSIKRMLVNANQQDEVRVAITSGVQLIDLDIETSGQEQNKSNIYKGEISSIEPSLGAVFVNYGSDRHGFLPLKEISSEYFLGQDGDVDNTDIKKLLKEGQPLVVQVEKEERGSKGAALTTFISLAGSFLVLMPNSPRAGGISRRIEGEERDQLRDTIEQLQVPEGMGIIIRTAGVQRTKEELEWDLNILMQYWEAIKQAATLKPGPYLIHQESDVIIRSIRDYLRQDMDEIIVDDGDAYQRAHHYLSQIRPDLINRLKLYKDPLPLFSRFQIEQQIETAYQREVRLPSGGSIVIDHSEALVAIDINSARATKGSNIEETALNTNLEAAEEIARQLRIRDIGGLVVIDFIDMTPLRNQREVENCLRNALRHDRARIQLGRISRFGLMEMSRQRIRSSLTRLSHLICPRCEGQRSIRSVESQAVSIIHIVQEQASKANNMHFQLQLPLDLATFIMNEKRSLIQEIEHHYHAKVTIIPNEFMESPHYQIKQIKNNGEIDQNKELVSYKVLKSLHSEPAFTSKKIAKIGVEPAVNQFLSQGEASGSCTVSQLRQKKPISSRSSSSPNGFSNGFIKRLWTKIFGSAAASEPSKSTPVGKSNPSNKKTTRQHYRTRPATEQGGLSADKNRTRRGSRGGHRNSGYSNPRPPIPPSRNDQHDASSGS